MRGIASFGQGEDCEGVGAPKCSHPLAAADLGASHGETGSHWCPKSRSVLSAGSASSACTVLSSIDIDRSLLISKYHPTASAHSSDSVWPHFQVDLHHHSGDSIASQSPVANGTRYICFTSQQPSTSPMAQYSQILPDSLI